LLQFSDIALAVAELKATPILSTIRGLLTNDVPLWRLTTLLDERWMDEDVFNALVELMYFTHQARISLLPHDPTMPVCLFLPTSFLSDARRHYQGQQRQYTTEILDLRQCLLLTTIQSISITSIFDNHYTAYVYRVGSTVVDHGDSLHQPPADDILDIISWVITGLGHPPVDSISTGIISQQGGFNGGEGSCGIAALNFIECYADTELHWWEGSNSHLFRDMALQNLIHYHDGAQIENFCGLTTVWNIVANISLPQPASAISKSPLASGYIDFNMYLPLVSKFYLFARAVAYKHFFSQNLHPIYTFIPHKTVLQNQLRNRLPTPGANPAPASLLPSSTQIKLDRATPAAFATFSVPLIGSLASTLVSAPTKLESPFFISPTRPVQKRRNDRLESSSPTQSLSRRQRRRLQSVISISSDSETSPSVIKHLRQTLVLPKMEASQSDVMDLCSSPEDRKPLSLAMKQEPLPSRWQHFHKHGSPVIDLCGSPEPKAPPRGKQPTSITADRPCRSVELAPGIVRKGSVFNSGEEAREAIYAHEARLGHCWRIAQGKIDQHGNRKKVTFCCNHYYHAVPVHSTVIDPADHRRGKTIKTECLAHVNINCISNSSLYHVTLTHWDHNYPREIPEGAPIRRKPTAAKKAEISKLATSSTQIFTRGQIVNVLDS
jgi:hypothetical protein